MRKTINIVTTVSTIVAVPLSIYLYFKTIEKREPVFLSNPYPLNILDKDLIKSAPIKIVTENNEEINGSVFSNTFYFFNQGKKPIKKENILSPIAITLSDSTARVLDFKILKVSREVTNLKLLTDTVPNLVNINFDILEENDGIVGQIVYTSNGSPELKIIGVIEGTNNFITSIEPMKLSSIIRLASQIGTLVIIVLYLWLSEKVFTFIRNIIPNRSIAAIVYSTPLVIFIIIYIIHLFQSSQPEPINPFNIPDSLRL